MKLQYSLLLAFFAITHWSFAVPGDLDLGFSTPLTEGGGIFGLSQQADGKVFAAGGWSRIGASGHRGIGRFDAVTGALDDPYSAATTGQFPRGLRFQADGKLLIFGGFSHMNGVARNKVARLNADGTLDTTFVDPQVGDFEVYSALPQTDGKILICGFFTQVAGVTRNYLARLNADGTLDTAFNPNPNADIQSMALLPDGKIVIVGNFFKIGDDFISGIAILNSDGTLNPADLPVFNSGESIAVQPDGKIIIGGRFTTVEEPNGIFAGNVLTRNGMVRLNANYSVDTSFNPDLGVFPNTAAGRARSIALQADGKMLIVGDFITVGGVSRISAARLNADGSLDTSFNPDLNGTVNNAEGFSALIQADGKMLVGGFHTNVGTIQRKALARFENYLPTENLSITNSNSRIQWLRGGSAPEARQVVFEQSTNSGATWTTLGNATRITGGWELTGLSLPTNVRIRATALTTGGLWNGSGGIAQTVEDFPIVPPAIVVEQPTSTPLDNGTTVDLGNIVTGLSSSTFTFTVRNTGTGLLKRLQMSIEGANATDFVLTPLPVSELATSGSSTFTIVFTPGARSARTATLRIGSNDPTNPIFTVPLTGTGVASPNADLAGIGLPSPLTVSPTFEANTLSYTASAIFNRTSVSVTPTAVNAVSTITVNGVAVPSGTASAPIALTTGANVITIVVTAENGVNTKTYTLTVNRAATSLGGDLDMNFSPYVSQTVHALAIQADGKILVGGIFAYVGAPFNSVGNISRNGIARLNPDASWDESFNAEHVGTVSDMRQLSNGQIVLVGTYAIGSGQSTHGLSVINADGSRVDTIDTRTDSFIHKLAIDTSGRSIIVGEFTTVQHLGAASATTRNRIARINANGTLDNTFNPNVNGRINAVLVQPDGDILIGGEFTQVGSTARSFVARINSNGSVDNSFTADASVDSSVLSLALQPDGKILVGGAFGPTDGLIRLNANGTLDSTFISTEIGNRQVRDITVLDSGKILVSGEGVAAQGHSAIERLNADGTLDTAFNASVGTNETVYTSLFTDAGQIIIGGQFTSANGVARSSLARLDGNTIQSLVPTSGAIVEWQRSHTPVATATAFDVSTDGANTWSVIDATGTRSGNLWQGNITTPLPTTGGLLRGRAAIPGGRYAAALSHVSPYSPPAAEIVVEEPLNNELTDGETVNFGSLGLNVLNQIPFTVRNMGGLPLTGVVVTITGTNANQFSLIAAPDSSLDPLDSATFMIQARPTSLGAKTAILRIASNDSDENPFDINIQCTGVAANLPVVATTTATSAFVNDILRATLNGTVDANSLPRDVFFDYGTTTAYGNTVAATNPVESGANAVPVNAVIEGLLPHTTYNFRVRAVSDLGNATGANRTFVTPNRAPQGVPDTAIVLPLASVTIDATDNDTDPDGDELIVTARTSVTPSTAGTVTITAGKLVFTASAAFGTAPNTTATFGYTLSDTFAGGTATSTVTVSPGSCSLSPTSNSVPSAGITYPVTITANGAPWNVTEALSWATVTPAKGIGDATVQVTLLPNTTINARTGSLKIGGVTHSITQAGVIAPVVSPAVGTFDTVVGDRNFSITIPSTNHPVTFTVASGTLPPGLTLNPTTGIISGIPTLGGTPTRAYPLSIKATNSRGNSTTPSFTINVDALPAGAIGTFHGFVTPSATANFTAVPHLGGRFEMTTSANGAVNGQIFEGVTKRTFSGTLSTTLATKQNPTLTAPLSGTLLSLNLTLDTTNNNLTGVLGNLSTSTTIEAWRNVWTTTNLPTSYALLNGTPIQHNILLRNTDDTNGPQGDGYCSFIVNRTTGTYTLFGKLSDETKTSTTNITTSFIGPQGQVLFYLPLYGNRGALGGVLRVDPTITGDNQTQGALTWIKPQPLPASKDTVYKDGFGPLTVSAIGNPYIAPAIGQRVLGAALSTSANNSTLSFIGGGLTPDFSQALLIRSTTTTANTTVVPAFNLSTSTNLNRVVLPVLNAPTGLFNGSFTIAGATTAANRVAPFYGQIIRIVTPTSDTTRGYGFFLLPTVPVSPQTVSTSPKLSGKLTFTAP